MTSFALVNMDDMFSVQIASLVSCEFYVCFLKGARQCCDCRKLDCSYDRVLMGPLNP